MVVMATSTWKGRDSAPGTAMNDVRGALSMLAIFIRASTPFPEGRHAEK